MRNLWLLLVLLMAWPVWAQRGPLLEAQKVLVTGPAVEGQEARVSVVVFNRGDATAYGVSCTLSCNGVEWGTLSKAQELAQNSQVTLEGMLKVPKGGLGTPNADGTPRLVARVGQFFMPDLVIEKLELPEIINRGEPADIKITVQNRGRGPAGGPVLELLVDGKALETKRTLGRLNEGAREVVVISWTPVREGKAELTAVLDRARKIDEQDEGNNTQAQSVTVKAERSTALRVTELALESREARVGSPVRLRLGITNTGELEVYRVPLVLQVNGKEIQSKTYYVELKGGGSAELFVRFTPHEGGPQTVTAILGPPGARPEAALHNSAAAKIDVIGRAGYHLRVTSLEAPSRVASGKDYILTAIVKNSGDMPSDVCKVALLANGVRVATARADRGLSPGEETRIKVRWSPSKVGRIKLGALADGSGPENSQDDEKPYEVEVQVEDPAR